MKKGKIFVFLLLIGILPVGLLLAYLYTGSSSPAENKPGGGAEKILIESEKRLGNELVMKNAKYVAMLLRKIEVEGRNLRDFSENIYSSPSLFAEPNYKKYKASPQYGFYWNPDNRDGGSALFVSRSAQFVAENRKNYTVTEHLDFIMKRVIK
ncbi:MAG: hypothetical protein WCI43_05805, partial [Candidatus Firestonebacteria bacterium]